MWKLCGWLLFASSAGDVVSTELALSRPGIVERNALMRDRPVRLVAHVAAPAVMWHTTEWIYPRNRVLAWSLRIGAIAAMGYATAHNLRKWRGPP